MALHNVFNAIVSTEPQRLTVLLAQPKYIYQVIQIFNMMRGLTFSSFHSNEVWSRRCSIPWVDGHSVHYLYASAFVSFVRHSFRIWRNHKRDSPLFQQRFSSCIYPSVSLIDIDGFHVQGERLHLCNFLYTSLLLIRQILQAQVFAVYFYCQSMIV